ncbi:hypothetical protein [Burkholderia multivorans]|uniref:hypothetical protein n=1 Tax=Burkholderia multivorans TaxID=87883 RepID=UPI0021C07A42|nr:hypothetical protein [Burkholderia multivorans]
MSKLFTLKQWLTVQEAARHLSRLFNEEVAESDIFRFALDGRLKLSVHFVNNAHANPGRFVAEDEVEWHEFEFPSDGEMKTLRLPEGIDVGDGRWIVLEPKVVTLQDVWDLPLIGAERLDVEHEYQRLTKGPEITLINIHGTFVENDAGIVCRLCEHFDDNEHMPGSAAYLKTMRYEMFNAMTPEEADQLRQNAEAQRIAYSQKMASLADNEKYYPSARLPEDGVFVVRSKHLTQFISSLEEPKAKSDEQSMSAKERSSVMKIIATLLSLSDLKGGTYKQAEGIVNAAKDLGISVSVNTVDKFLKEASSIEKEKTHLK